MYFVFVAEVDKWSKTILEKVKIENSRAGNSHVPGLKFLLGRFSTIRIHLQQREKS